jgi:aerobic-type carbon monoxide dehydrogenase small subunit (CoxS/CutS family)
MTGNFAIVLNVNGEPRDMVAMATTTLLDALRYSLELTGTKRGCNHGVCGACTVLLDGKLARSCLTLAVDVGERPVTTVEGIASGNDLSPVQRALLDAGAIQCGFCTPGFVLALTELFARERSPGRAQIRDALSGNLCRCSGYVKIVEAAELLAAAQSGRAR